MIDAAALLEAAAAEAAPGLPLSEWWRETSLRIRDRYDATVDCALQAGGFAPALQHAFIAGYRCAVEAVAPGRISPGELASFAVTEEGGGHPRQIETTLTPVGDGFCLNGTKSWATLVPLAPRAIVIARAGTREDGRPRLTACIVSLDQDGVTMRPRPPFPVMPDVPHAVVTFDEVFVPGSAVLPGDAYEQMVRPFRTAEDLHVLSAVTGLGLRLAVGLRHAELVAEMLAIAELLTGVLAGLELSNPRGHLLLAGAMAQSRASWAQMLSVSRERGQHERAAILERDLGVFSVAAKARHRRTERALERLLAS
ncbi:MAG: hypothetical protein D6761_06190 [Candidatus Dadabacteria bacterium]|nr:MAG: hypothetical protein D6761_06190 [Candidatus Dadabacteria bacterium]